MPEKPLAPGIYPAQQRGLGVLKGLKAKARQRRDFAPALLFALLQMDEKTVTGFYPPFTQHHARVHGYLPAVNLRATHYGFRLYLLKSG